MQSGRNWNEYPAAKWRRVIKHVLISQTHCDGRTARGGGRGRQRPTANVDNGSQLPIGAVGRQQEAAEPPNVAHNVLQTSVNCGTGAKGQRDKGCSRGRACARRCCVFVVGAVKIQ